MERDISIDDLFINKGISVILLMNSII